MQMPLQDLLARISKLLVISYAIDWIFIMYVALIAQNFNFETLNS